MIMDWVNVWIIWDVELIAIDENLSEICEHILLNRLIVDILFKTVVILTQKIAD